MTFDDFLNKWKKDGGTQKGFGLEIGISEAAMSRLVHRKNRVGMRMLNRIAGAAKGEITTGELMRDYRPDIYNQIMEEAK